MAEISTIFNQPGAGFVLLPNGIKFPPLEKAWQEKPHSYQEAVAHHGNVGILTGSGYIGLDQDRPEAFVGLELPISTTWETRPGRLGMWFVCVDCTPEVLAKHGKKADHAQFKLYRDGQSVGEIKLRRTYQVIPNSWKTLEDGTRVDYRLLQDTPPAEISLEKLLGDLQNLSITFSSKLDANAAKLGNLGKKVRQRRVESDETRTRRYAEAALRDEALALAGTPDGNRNEQLNRSAFALGQFVAAGVLSESEVVSELAKAAINIGLEPEEIEKTIISGLQAGSRHPREIPERAAPESTGDLLEKIKADPRALKEPAVLALLAVLKAADPIEYDIFIEWIKKTHKGLKVATINGMVDKHIQESEKATEERPGEEISEDIQKIATRIAEHGKPLKYMLNTFTQTHKGDKLHAESQFIGFGMQSAYNTKGVFGTWDGPSGKGKTDGARACVKQLPLEYTIISSITAKSMYHRAKDGSMLPGTVLFLDDKNIEAGSDLEETLKNIQTFFQEGAEHETLDGNGGYVKTKLPPRLLVVRTYVNSADTDGQLKNRSLDFGVDSSKTTDKEVCDLVLKLGESGQTTDIVTRRTLICRALWQDIKGKAYRVIHPASSQLIEFSDVSNRRNPSLFLDMVVGLVCIHHRQCDTEDGPNGEKILYATYADYVEAARLFNSQGDYLGTRLDKAEFEAVQYIKDQGNEGGSINSIFTHLAEKFPNDGWNTQKVRRLMDGRQDRELKGLSDSVPGIETRWEYMENGSKYKVYSIPGELALGVRVTVHDPRTKIISSEDLSHLSRRFPTVGKEENDSSGTTTPTSYPNYPNTTKDEENRASLERGEGKAGNDNILDGDTCFGKTGKRG